MSLNASERTELKRRNKLDRLRLAWASGCFEADGHTIHRSESRRLSTVSLGYPDPRTVDRYEQTLLDAKEFEITLDGEGLHMIVIPYELAEKQIKKKAD